MSLINVPNSNGIIGNLTVNGTLTASGVTTNAVPSKYSHCSIDANQNLISSGNINLTMTQIGGKGGLLSSTTTFLTPSATKYYKFNAYILVNVTAIGVGGYLRLWIQDTAGSFVAGTSIRLYDNNLYYTGYTPVIVSGIVQGGMNANGTLTLGLFAGGSLTGTVLQGYVTVEEYNYGAT